MRLFIVDTLTTIVFFTAVASMCELLIAGMAPKQVLLTRAMMIPIMIATGRPYGAWRDWLLRKLRPRGTIARFLVDVAAFLLFQVPVYAATLALAGAAPGEIAVAIASAIGFMVVLSRPFGMLLDAVHSMTRTAGIGSDGGASRQPR